jgi:hypothetical protein
MKKYLPIVIFSSIVLCGGCTISVVDTHTESGSQETVDQDQAADAQVNPNFNVPIKSGSSSIILVPGTAIK